MECRFCTCLNPCCGGISFYNFDYQKCIDLSVLRFSWGHRVNVLLCYWLGVSPHIFRKSTIFFLHIGVFFINKWLIICYWRWLLDGCIFRKRNAPTLVFPLSRTFFYLLFCNLMVLNAIFFIVWIWFSQELRFVGEFSLLSKMRDCRVEVCFMSTGWFWFVCCRIVFSQMFF